MPQEKKKGKLERAAKSGRPLVGPPTPPLVGINNFLRKEARDKMKRNAENPQLRKPVKRRRPPARTA